MQKSFHAVQPETTSVQSSTGESTEDNNWKKKMWKKFSLEEICVALFLIRCEKTEEGALQQCSSKKIV